MSSAETFLTAVGKATSCAVSATHRAPGTLVYVWHHVQPKGCGGPTTAANLVSLCDNCHRSTHVLLYDLKLGRAFTSGRGMAKQKALALRGYAECQRAGTVDKIPDEGMPANG
jgi:hypothetical protein